MKVPSLFVEKLKVFTGQGQHICEVLLMYVKRKWSCGAETAKSLKSKFYLWPFGPKSIEVFRRSRSTYMWSIIITCQMKEELLYRKHFFTDRQMGRQTGSHGETSIPPQLSWRGYTNLFSIWRNRWKMTPWKSKFHGGSHFFTTFGSKFNVEKWPGESCLTLKNDPGSHFSTGSLFNVTPVQDGMKIPVGCIRAHSLTIFFRPKGFSSKQNSFFFLISHFIATQTNRIHSSSSMWEEVLYIFSTIMKSNCWPILAHLSWRLKSSVVVRRRPLIFHIFDFFSRTAWWILMKLGRDEVLMVPYKCCCFSARSTQGRIQGGAKIGQGGPLLKETSSSDRKATATNRMHSNDLEACGKKCCYFWFHSEVKFLTGFNVFFFGLELFLHILMQFL